MRWYHQALIGIIIISIVLGAAWREWDMRKYPLVVRHYAELSEKIALPEERQRLKDYVLHDEVWIEGNLSDLPKEIQQLEESLDGVSMERLLTYLRHKLTYTRDPHIKRHEDPISILDHKQPKRLPIDENKSQWAKTGESGTFGRCGEFSIAFTALCLAFDIRARMLICLSDHVWAEVYHHIPQGGRWDTGGTSEGWIHVDPTENKINDPYLYARPEPEGWAKDFGGNDKVYALESGNIKDVTKRYIWNENKDINKGD